MYMYILHKKFILRVCWCDVCRLLWKSSMEAVVQLWGVDRLGCWHVAPSQLWQAGTAATSDSLQCVRDKAAKLSDCRRNDCCKLSNHHHHSEPESSASAYWSVVAALLGLPTLLQSRWCSFHTSAWPEVKLAITNTYLLEPCMRESIDRSSIAALVKSDSSHVSELSAEIPAVRAGQP